MMGIKDLHFLGLEDDAELLTQGMIFEIAEKFREIRPHVVITHHPYEEGGFKLHASVGRAVMFARRGYMIDHMASMPGGQRPDVPPYQLRRELYDR